MNFNIIMKEIMRGEKIYNLPLRVCFYARVSTESDVQLNSLDNQLSYYKNFIDKNKNWSYVRGYVDEGKSGVRVHKRNGFMKMIEDAKKGDFDLIITKEVSRFARDLEDSIHFIRELKEANVGVFFENQNLNTFDSNSELILNIMFNIAQDESRKLSERVKFGHKEAIKKGHVLGSSNIIGYKKGNCRLIIDEDEAKIIRKIFELYVTGKYGLYKLSKKLGEYGYLNKNGNLFDKDTLKRIIENPKYKGFYRGRTYEVVDYRTKKRVKIEKDEQIIYKSKCDIIPAIVSEELWNKANEILELRHKKYKNNCSFSGGLKYPFSSKIYCGEHNKCFQRCYGGKQKKRIIYSCANYLKYGVDSCLSPLILEDEFYSIMKVIIEKTICNRGRIILDLFDLYESSVSNYDNEIELINISIRNIEKKKSLMLDLVIDKKLKYEELIYQFAEIEEKLNKLYVEKENILKQSILQEKNKNNLNNLRDNIKKDIFTNIIDDFIRVFVNKIVVSKINGDRCNIRLDIYLNLYDGKLENSKIFLLNQVYNESDLLCINKRANKYIYNIYLF